jgi:hypothetical protein
VRIDEREVTVLSYSESDESRLRITQESTVSLALHPQVFGFAIQLMKGTDRNVVEQSLPKITPEGSRMVRRHSCVFIKVEDSNSVPLDVVVSA